MIEVHGHRGARAVLPENTLAGFEYAISVGADYIEMDVAVTRDDVLVLSHDPVLRSGQVIRELTREELRHADPAVPELDEVLALAGGKNRGQTNLSQTSRSGAATRGPVQWTDPSVPGFSRPPGEIGFNIEMKSYPDQPEFTPPPERCAALVLEAIRRRGVAARAIVESFDHRVLRVMRRIAPRIRLAALVEEGDPDLVATAREAEAEMIAPEFHMVTAEKVASAHAAGIGVVTWTVNAPEDWQRLDDAGVDGIITDDPAALATWLRRR